MKNRAQKGFLFRGFATCGSCGYAITSEKHTKKSGLRFLYYRCTGKSKTIACSEHLFTRQEKLADEIKRNTQTVCLPDEWKEKFLAKLDLMEAEGAVTGSKQSENLTPQLASVKAKIQRLTALYVEGGLDLNEFKASKNAFVEEKVSLEQKLKNIQGRANRLEPVRNWILEANQANSLGFSDNHGQMAEFLKQVGSNRLLRGGNLFVEFKKPWNSLAETSVTARSAEPNSDQSSKWWRRRELNPRV